jgi:hypothetical protein
MELTQPDGRIIRIENHEAIVQEAGEKAKTARGCGSNKFTSSDEQRQTNMLFGQLEGRMKSQDAR